jgi:hypothetical protein
VPLAWWESERRSGSGRSGATDGDGLLPRLPLVLLPAHAAVGLPADRRATVSDPTTTEEESMDLTKAEHHALHILASCDREGAGQVETAKIAEAMGCSEETAREAPTRREGIRGEGARGAPKPTVTNEEESDAADGSHGCSAASSASRRELRRRSGGGVDSAPGDPGLPGGRKLRATKEGRPNDDLHPTPPRTRPTRGTPTRPSMGGRRSTGQPTCAGSHGGFFACGHGPGRTAFKPRAPGLRQSLTAGA